MELPLRTYPSVEEAERYLDGLESDIALSGNQQKTMSKKLIEALLMIDHQPRRESGSWQGGMRTAWSIVFDLMGTPIEPAVHGNPITRSYLHYPIPEKDDGSGHGCLYPLPDALPRRVIERGTADRAVRERPSVTLSREWPSGITIQAANPNFSGWARPSTREQPTAECAPGVRPAEMPRRPVRDRLSSRSARDRRNSFERGSRNSMTSARSYHGAIRRLTGRERKGSVGDVWIGTKESVQDFCIRYGLRDPTPSPPPVNEGESTFMSDVELARGPDVQVDLPGLELAYDSSLEMRGETDCDLIRPVGEEAGRGGAGVFPDSPHASRGMYGRGRALMRKALGMDD